MTDAQKALQPGYLQPASPHPGPQQPGPQQPGPQQRPLAITADTAPPRPLASSYPAPLAARVAGRTKRPLGEAFGLRNFGVNLTTLAPGAASALRHAHSRQDELVYVLAGEPTLISDAGTVDLKPGMCAGFAAGSGNAHHLVNRTERPVTYLEIGDRTAGDEVRYPDDDIAARLGTDGRWRYTRKDGTGF
jgi:uncharacterized cupin superfamily protein